MDKKKKKILFVNGHLNVGGVEKSLVDLLNRIDYSRYDVDVLLLEGLGDYRSRLPEQARVLYRDIRGAYGPWKKVLLQNLLHGRPADIFYRLVLLASGRGGMKRLKYLRWVLPLCKTYDVAIAYRPGISSELVAYTVRSKRKLGWWHHGSIDYDEAEKQRYVQTIAHLDKLVTVSEGCRVLLEKELRLPARKVTVIPNLVNMPQIAEDANRVSGAFPDAGERQRWVTVGRMAPEKHMENVVYAARQLVAEGYRHFIWYLIGDGTTYEEVDALVHLQKMEAYVILLGAKPNPYPYIRQASMLVHPSYVESQSLTVLEAMTLRTPVVACRNIGTEEYLRTGVNGILVEPGVEALVDGIKQMLALGDDRQRMVEAAYQTVKQRFSGQQVIAEFEQLVTHLLEEKSNEPESGEER